MEVDEDDIDSDNASLILLFLHQESNKKDEYSLILLVCDGVQGLIQHLIEVIYRG